MMKKVEDYVKEYHMLQAGDTVVAGVSGGADSVCLLFVLQEMRKKLPFELIVVHVNHLIREEAENDAEHVRELCKKWDCRFVYRKVDVSAYAEKNHVSTEEAGRILRYQVFEEVLKENSVSGKIAVAHNQNDNAETILFHLMRGTGLQGMVGIRPVRDHIIRPLLCLSREEIENFLNEKQISYCIDRTNNEDTYTRNRIRHHILKYAENNICEGATEHISEAGNLLLQAQEYIQERVEEAFERCCQSSEEGIFLQVKIFLQEATFIQKQLLMEVMSRVAGKRKDISGVHVQALRELFVREGNGEKHLPYGIRAYREYDKVRIVRETLKKEQLQEQKLMIPGNYPLNGNMRLECSVFPYEKSQIIPRKTYTKWFDYDKIEKSLVLRSRKSGDYLIINTKGNAKSLKEYFIEQKIPKEKREEIPVIAQDDCILWVVGYRSSEHCRVDQKTKTVLQLQIIGGTSDG